MANKYEYYIGNLKNEYREVFDKIEQYAKISSIDEKYKEETLSSILDTFLNAQAENKDVSKVVGNDLEKFCRQCFSEKTVREHILPLFEYMLPFALVWLLTLAWNMFVIIYERHAFGEKIDFFHLSVSLGNGIGFRLNGIGVAVTAVFSYLVFWLTNHKMKKMLFGKHSQRVLLIQYMKWNIFILCLIVGIVADTIIPFCIPAWIECIISLSVIAAYIFVKIHDKLTGKKVS